MDVAKMYERTTHAVGSASADELAGIIARTRRRLANRARFYLDIITRFQSAWLSVDDLPKQMIGLTRRGGGSGVSEVSGTISQPLLLSPITLEKVWGGDQLARRFPSVVATRPNVGEVWVAWDGLVVASGDRAGQTLVELYAGSPAELLGPAASGPWPEAFPLLVKLLDARENLSIQVHPDDAYARVHEGQPFGKCEMWYVLEAARGAAVYHGLRRDMSADDFRGAIRGPGILEAVERVEVQAGDVLINTPGVVHALGAGVVIFELQQSCDLTYRLYDWNRGEVGGARRDLHLDQGADVADRRRIRQHKIAPVTLAAAPVRRVLLAACRYFAAELVELSSGGALSLPGGRLHVLTALDGAGLACSSAPGAAILALQAGQTCLLPAALTGTDVRASGPTRLIRSYIPELRSDVIDPLRALGVPDNLIAQLGGDGDRSDLWRLLRGI
jgi:mannose-6-phosphate isomerase